MPDDKAVADQLRARVTQLREALRKLMKESVAVVALAEPTLREEIGHTNFSVFQLRINEAAVLLIDTDEETKQNGCPLCSREHEADCDLASSTCTCESIDTDEETV